MAQYEAQCSKVGSFAYSQYFKLYVILTDGEVSGNYSKVNYNVFCQSSGSGSIDAQHWKYFNLNGQEIVNITEKIKVSSPNAYIHIASGTTDWIEHNSDGSKSIWFSAQIKANSYGVVTSLEGTFNLINVPRYSEINSFSIQSMGLNTATLQYSVSRSANIYCSVDGMAWGNPRVSNTTSGTFTISGLSPNANHSFAILVRAVDSGLDRISETIFGNTLNIGTVTSASDINFGDTVTIVKSNPSGARNDLRIEILNPTTTIAIRTQVPNNYALSLSDKEWDILYKKLGDSNSITIRYVIDTIDGSNKYYHWVDRTLSLKGNQKTIRTNVNNEWKRGKLWTNNNGSWKRAVVWQNIEGTWKRGI